jgi:hypothetical protein
VPVLAWQLLRLLVLVLVLHVWRRLPGVVRLSFQFL